MGNHETYSSDDQPNGYIDATVVDGFDVDDEDCMRWPYVSMPKRQIGRLTFTEWRKR
ncbi:hypothetical protein [Numidum massiliense]|uniref:hypothetical protein n=1 Tax=Numidum massiliense TaxID=1522315 RepID=UPI0012F9858E|nr:hypothetical protein [Numidum massiliense]